MTKLYVSFRAASAASGSPRHEEAGTHRHVGRMPRVRRSAPRKRAHVSALPPSHRHDGRAGPGVHRELFSPLIPRFLADFESAKRGISKTPFYVQLKATIEKTLLRTC